MSTVSATRNKSQRNYFVSLASCNPLRSKKEFALPFSVGICCQRKHAALKEILWLGAGYEAGKDIKLIFDSLIY
jgi:hypothetical protein